MNIKTYFLLFLVIACCNQAIGQIIEGFALVRAATNDSQKFIQNIKDGDIIDYYKLPWGMLSIEVKVNRYNKYPKLIITLEESDGDPKKFKTLVKQEEGVAPYLLYGDQMIQQKRYYRFDKDRALKPGKLYRLTASIQGTNRRKTIMFSMMELRFFLVNSRGRMININGISSCNDKLNDPNCRGLEGKQILDLKDLPSSFSLEATINPTNLNKAQVKFDQYNTTSHLTNPEGSPTRVQLERVLPYTLYGDGNGSVYNWKDKKPGEHYLIRATPIIYPGTSRQFRGISRTLQIHFRNTKSWGKMTYSKPYWDTSSDPNKVVIIENKVFDFNSFNSGAKNVAIKISNASRVVIRNCFIKNFKNARGDRRNGGSRYEASISLSNVRNLHIQNVYIENAGLGIRVKGNEKGEDNIFIHDVQIKDFYAGYAMAFRELKGENIKIFNNSFYNECGRSTDCFNFYNVKGTSNSPIQFYGNIGRNSNRAEFRSNKESNPRTNGTGGFIVIEDGSRYINVFDNVCVSPTVHGVQLESRPKEGRVTRDIHFNNNILQAKARNKSGNSDLCDCNGTGRTGVGIQYELSAYQGNTVVNNRVLWFNSTGLHYPNFPKKSIKILNKSLLNDLTLNDKILPRVTVYRPVIRF